MLSEAMQNFIDACSAVEHWSKTHKGQGVPADLINRVRETLSKLETTH